MAKNPNVMKELKALGRDLSAAFNQMRASREFQSLRREVSSGVKSISDSLVRSLKAAQKSPATKKIKHRVRRVVKAGGAEGKARAVRAQAAAAQNLRKIRSTVKDLSSKLKKAP